MNLDSEVFSVIFSKTLSSMKNELKKQVSNYHFLKKHDLTLIRRMINILVVIINV